MTSVGTNWTVFWLSVYISFLFSLVNQKAGCEIYHLKQTARQKAEIIDVFLAFAFKSLKQQIEFERACLTAERHPLSREEEEHHTQAVKNEGLLHACVHTAQLTHEIIGEFIGWSNSHIFETIKIYLKKKQTNKKKSMVIFCGMQVSVPITLRTQSPLS